MRFQISVLRINLKKHRKINLENLKIQTGAPLQGMPLPKLWRSFSSCGKVAETVGNSSGCRIAATREIATQR